MSNYQQSANFKDIIFKNIFVLILILGTIVLFYTNDKVDYNAYYTASKAFQNHENPYNKNTLLRYQQQIDPKIVKAIMVWNPPMFFSTFGIILLMPEQFKLTLWLIVSILSVIGLAVAGTYWRDPANFKFKNLEIEKIALCTFCCMPFIIQTIIGQFSSWIYFAFIIGLLAFSERRDFVAGIFMSLSLVKPHLFLLVYLAFGYEVLKERRFKVVLGGIFGAMFFSTISEFYFPEIHKLWFYREQWPVEYLGATLPSLLKDLFFISTNMKVLQIIALSMGIILLFIFKVSMFEYNFKLFIIFSIIINLIFSPYGFNFDQSCLIFVLTFLLSSDLLRKSEVQGQKLYSAVLLFYIIHILVYFTNSKVNIDWYLFPIFVAGLFGKIYFFSDKRFLK